MTQELMQRYRRQLSPQERELIGFELDRLFSLQDRRLDDQKKNFILLEIERLGVSYETIASGLRSLFDEDTKNLKFATIKDAILRGHKTEERHIHCDNCDGTGLVHFKDAKKRYWVVACICEAGDRTFRQMGLVRWNGKDSQFVNGEEMMRDYYREREKAPISKK